MDPDSVTLTERPKNTRYENPQLLASTGIRYTPAVLEDRDGRAAISQTESEAQLPPVEPYTTVFKSARWSPDGTTILTCSEDNVLRSFILPAELLTAQGLQALAPYTSYDLPSPAYATAFYPSYSLSNPSSALFLASSAFLPIRLYSLFGSGIVASYPLVNRTTEAVIAPHSLLFQDSANNANHFFAGSDCQISVFDISRNGQGPLEEIKTIPSRRKKIVGGGVGMKGIVSALGLSSEGILAAGTFTRWIGLYDGGGRGGTVGFFELGKNADDEEGVGEGAGITQVLWSSCGRYMCAAERGSHGIGVWDIRGTGQRLSWLAGRKARTMQRLGIEIVGDEVWAGGIDGRVRIWEGLGMREGVIDSEWSFEAHDDAVSSVIMHPCGNVLATCSGQRHPFKRLSDVGTSPNKTESDDSDTDDSGADSSDSHASSSLFNLSEDDPTIDNSLKAWLV